MTKAQAADAALIADFMRLRTMEDGTVLEVGTVEWETTHIPSVRWQIFRSWPGIPGPDVVATAETEALAAPEYFGRCWRCRERHNIGHMHSKATCQGCAERVLHVVY